MRVKTSLTLCLVFSLFTATADSQNYSPLAKTGFAWFQGWGVDYGGGGDGRDDLYTLGSDTIFNDQIYHRIGHLSQHYYFWYDMYGYHKTYGDILDFTYTSDQFLREDTLLKKVFLLSVSEGFDTTEELLYDFGLELGDTLEFGSTEKINIVSEIDSVLIGTVYRNRFSITSAEDMHENYVYLIEGVGSTFGLIASLEPPFESAEYLSCFYGEEGTTAFNDQQPFPYDSTFDCEFAPVVSIYSNTQTILSLSPNPVNDVLDVGLPASEGDNAIFIIYNSMGQSLGNYPTNSYSAPFQISTIDLIPGIYFIIAQTEKEIYSGRFFKL